MKNTLTVTMRIDKDVYEAVKEVAGQRGQGAFFTEAARAYLNPNRLRDVVRDELQAVLSGTNQSKQG